MKKIHKQIRASRVRSIRKWSKDWLNWRDNIVSRMRRYKNISDFASLITPAAGYMLKDAQSMKSSRLFRQRLKVCMFGPMRSYSAIVIDQDFILDLFNTRKSVDVVKANLTLLQNEVGEDVWNDVVLVGGTASALLGTRTYSTDLDIWSPSKHKEVFKRFSSPDKTHHRVGKGKASMEVDIKFYDDLSAELNGQCLRIEGNWVAPIDTLVKLREDLMANRNRDWFKKKNDLEDRNNLLGLKTLKLIS